MSQGDEESVPIQISAIDVYSVLLPLAQAEGADLNHFAPALELSVQQVVCCQENIASRGNMDLRARTLPFFNRIFLAQPKETLNFVQIRLPVAEFLVKWALAMSYLNNPTSRSINAFAISQMLIFAPPIALSSIIESLMSHSIPEVFNWIDKQQGYAPKIRPAIKKRADAYSERKEAFTKSIQPQSDLLVCWRQGMTEFQSKAKADGIRLPPFENEGLQENVLKLLQN